MSLYLWQIKPMNRLLTLIALLIIHVSYAQKIRNGKFCCRIDTSSVYDSEEYTLSLLEVNMVKLSSVKKRNVSLRLHRDEIRSIKEQFYTGCWVQQDDTVEVMLDLIEDKPDRTDYTLRFLVKKEGLQLLETRRIADNTYSDLFYGNSLWISRPFHQKEKARATALF